MFLLLKFFYFLEFYLKKNKQKGFFISNYLKIFCLIILSMWRLLIYLIKLNSLNN